MTDDPTLAAALAERGKPCVWKPDDDGWASSCGNLFVIIDGTPSSNDIRFCCYCGHPIKEERL